MVNGKIDETFSTELCMKFKKILAVMISRTLSSEQFINTECYNLAIFLSEDLFYLLFFFTTLYHSYIHRYVGCIPMLGN